MDRIISILISLLILAGFVSPAFAVGQPEIIFIGPNRQVQTDDQLVVEVQLDSASQQINAAELTIHYPTDELKVIRVGQEQSIFTVWAEQPSWDINRGLIKMIAGRPKGIIASRATVATIYFSVLKSGPTQINLITPDSRIFRHDGVGTPIALPAAALPVDIIDPLAGGLVLRSASHLTQDWWSRTGKIDINWDIQTDTVYSYILSQDRLAVPDDITDQLVVRTDYSEQVDGIYYFSIKSRTSGQDWSPITQRRFLLDQTSPEHFTIEVIDSTEAGNGKLLSWMAIDQTSGVSNYRLLVDSRDLGLVTSPIEYKPEWQNQKVTIIATDAAGNRRIENLARTTTSTRPPLTIFLISSFIVISLLLLIIGYKYLRRNK